MQISDLTSNPRLLVEQIRSNTLSQLRPGQVIQARVETAPLQGLAKLNVGGAELSVRTQSALTPGERLTIEVVKAGQVPELRVMRPATARDFQAQALRNLLPRQQPLDQLIGQLKSLLTPPPPRAAPNPAGNPLQSSPAASPNTASPAPSAPGNAAPLATASGTQVQRADNSTLFQQLVRLLQLPPTSGGSERTSAPRADTLQPQVATPGTTGQGQALTPGERVTRELLQAYQHLQGETLKSAANPRRGTGTPQPAAAAAEPGTAATAKPVTGESPANRVVKLVQEVLNQAVRGNETLSPQRLQQALNESGLFLEARLAAGQPPTVDLKSSLLRLLFLLRTEIPQHPATKTLLTLPGEQGATAQQPLLIRFLADLQSQIEGALARLQLHQLASLPADEAPRQVWQFELPLNMGRETDSFLLRFQQEARGNGEGGEALWSVNIEFDIEPLGPVSSRLMLNGEEISSHFSAERSESAELIERNLPKLEAAFLRAGLSIGKMSARQGRAGEPGQDHRPPFPLLDEKA